VDQKNTTKTQEFEWNYDRLHQITAIIVRRKQWMKHKMKKTLRPRSLDTILSRLPYSTESKPLSVVIRTWRYGSLFSLCHNLPWAMSQTSDNKKLHRFMLDVRTYGHSRSNISPKSVDLCYLPHRQRGDGGSLSDKVYPREDRASDAASVTIWKPASIASCAWLSSARKQRFAIGKIRHLPLTYIAFWLR